MAQDVFELSVGESADDGHNHVKVTIAGWECCFDKDGTEYFSLTGIAKPERVQAIIDAANGKSPEITDGHKKMIVGVLRDKVSSGLTSWIESQFAIGAEVEDVEKALTMALRQISRVNDHVARSSRADSRIAEGV